MGSWTHILHGCFCFVYRVRIYFNHSDCAKILNCVRICECKSCSGILGVGKKPRPLLSNCRSCGVSLYVLRLCIVRLGLGGT